MKAFYFISKAPLDCKSCALQQIETSDPALLESVAGNAAGWIIDMRDPQQGWQQLCELRGALNPSIYLKPALMLYDHAEVPEHMRNAFDAALKRDECSEQLLDDHISRLTPINQWIIGVKGSQDTNMAFKVLRWIASRNHSLTPLRTTSYKSGFVYPPLLPLFGGHDTSVFDTLNFLTEQNLLATEFFTKSHFCIHCDSAFLNFKECCPQCQSDDIEVNELIHHFKCAYTAEAHDFQCGEQLICPKCDRELRHIGVDYDKPSTICRCNVCNFGFQDAEVMTECFSCGRTTEHEHQRLARIYSYRASAIGFNAARHGLDELFSRQLESRLTLLPESAFRSFFHIEKERIKRYKLSTSSLAMVRLEHLDELYIRSGSRAPQLFAELSQIFKNVFRKTDVITARNESIFFVIMTETSLENAYIGLQRLEDAVTSLFQNNLQADLGLSVRAVEIAPDSELDSLLEHFLQP